MNKLAYLEGYLDKQADISLADVQGTFNNMTGNPAVRAALLGTAGYFGTKYGYKALVDTIARRQINSKFEDPTQREQAWKEHEQRRDKVTPWLAGGAAAIGAGIPLLAQSRGISKGFKAFGDTGNLGDIASGFLHNKMPAIYDKYGEEKSTMVEKQAFVGADFDHVGGVGDKGGTPMSSSPSYIDNSENDFALGKDFIMPVVRPPEMVGLLDVPKASSMDLLQTQSSVLGEDNTNILIRGMDQATPGERSGMISTMDIFQGLSRAGVGAVAGWGLANIMGTVFSQPPALKAKLANYGALGGALVNSGLLGTAYNKFKGLMS